ncbi:MAG: SDR family oxidoreductase [Coriobacteriales bacterium]|nr:SDR family oxidoreductase [Coriobacteriales bacterium]
MILVVGATGELGVRVCRRLLDAGEHVRAMTRSPERASAIHGMGAEVVTGDLRDRPSLEAAVASCDAIIHCATGRPSRRERRNSAHAVDDKGTAALVAAAREAGIRRIVYVSELGSAPDAPLETLRMKYRAEWHVLHSGLHFTILRPAAFAETWLGPMALRVARGQRPRIPGDARKPISFVSAEDVAALAVLALRDPDLEDRTMDVGGPAPVTLEQAVRAMERGSGRQVGMSHVPPVLMRLASMIVGIVDPNYAERLEGSWCMATHPYTCDISGLQRMLPQWRPSPVEPLVERLARAS